MEEFPKNQKPVERQKSLERARHRISQVEAFREATKERIIGCIKKDRERLRNKIPFLLRWIIPEKSLDACMYETPVNRIKMTLSGYLACNYDEILETLEQVVQACQRSNGKEVNLSEEELEALYPEHEDPLKN